MMNRNERPETGSRADNDIPVVKRTEIGSLSSEREGSVVGVVLAAGTSSRFGEANKLLTTVDGRPRAAWFRAAHGST